MGDVFTELHYKTITLIALCVCPEADIFDGCGSRKYTMGGQLLLRVLSCKIEDLPVDMGQLIGGDKYPLLTLLSGPISRLRNHTVKHKSSTLRPALELRLHGLCIICKTHVTHKISTARLSSRKVLCV